MERTDPEVRSRRDCFRDLHHRCMAIGIWMNDPENKMNLEELKKLSTKELTELYNKYADKQVKRMESRQKAEERTIQLLRDAGQWDDGTQKPREPATALEAKNIRETANAGINDGTPHRDASSKKKGNKQPRKPIEAPEPTNEGTNDMAAKNAKKKPATKSAKKTAAAPAAAEKKPRGAPTTNYTYTAIGEKAKGYNPEGLKLQAGSARGLVLEFIRGGESGKTRKQIEAKFPDINTKSALDVLVKYGFVTAKE